VDADRRQSKLELAPFLNQWWQVAFHLKARGVTTGLILYDRRLFEVKFDFIDHNLAVVTDRGQTKAMSLVPRSVADFYVDFMAALAGLGLWSRSIRCQRRLPTRLAMT
jgi:hypothetical protein